MLKVFGKELLSDSIKHCFDKYSDNIENVWNKVSDNMCSLKWNSYSETIIQ